MNQSSLQQTPKPGTQTDNQRPILLIPYMWIGDFVRCHTVVRLLKQQYPDRPVDVLTTTNDAPLVDYMPGVRKGIVVDLPRKRMPLDQHWALAKRLKAENYSQSLVMPRTWKAALAPFLAGIPVRTGFAGEVRFGLLNDVRWGEKKLPRMVDRCSALALPKGTPLPDPLPLPELRVFPLDIDAWRRRQNLEGREPVVVLAPGAVGPSKRWPASSYAELARDLAAQGYAIWIVGGPGEKAIATEIVQMAPTARDLTGTDLRNAILALATAKAAVSNDSGLLHVAAALGTPAIGIFGPTSPWHWAPLNPIAAVIQAPTEIPCRPCHKPVCRLEHHSCMRDISLDMVMAATRSALNP